MGCAEDALADIGLDLCVLAHHLYAKHHTSPVAAFRELTLRTHFPFCSVEAQLATSPAALRETAWHRAMSSRWAAMRARVREEESDCVQEATAVAHSLYAAGCDIDTYADALRTCAEMLTRSIPAHRIKGFITQRVAELRAGQSDAVSADELARDMVERLLLDALCPARWWEHNDAEKDDSVVVTVRAVAMNTSPPHLSIFYTRGSGEMRVRRIALSGLLHATGPTAPLARRLIRSHGAIIGEEELRGYLLRLQRMMTTKKDTEQLRKEEKPVRASAMDTASMESTSASAPLVLESATSLAKGIEKQSAPNKADVGMLYRDPEAALANVDLNDADEVTLREFKEKMEEDFQDKAVRPDHPDYVYDKRVEVQPTQRSDWDDDSD